MKTAKYGESPTEEEFQASPLTLKFHSTEMDDFGPYYKKINATDYEITAWGGHSPIGTITYQSHNKTWRDNGD